MTTKLTDAQLLMLTAAAQREDRILAMPPNLKGAAAQKVAAKLIAAGLVKEIKAKTGAPVMASRCRDRAVLRTEADGRWPEGERDRQWRRRE